MTPRTPARAALVGQVMAASGRMKPLLGWKGDGPPGVWQKGYRAGRRATPGSFASGPVRTTKANSHPGTEGEATWDTEEIELSCDISVPDNVVAGDCTPSGVLETGKSCQTIVQPRVRWVWTIEV